MNVFQRWVLWALALILWNIVDPDHPTIKESCEDLAYRIDMQLGFESRIAEEDSEVASEKDAESPNESE